MKVHVRYYAALREIIGLSSEDIEIKEGTPLDSFVDMIKNRNIDIKDLVILVALNEKYSKSNVILVEGDRIALFPPVSGG